MPASDGGAVSDDSLPLSAAEAVEEERLCREEPPSAQGRGGSSFSRLSEDENSDARP